MSLATERAAYGAELLDQINPGWEQRVNDQTLQMNDCATCIQGQLYGMFGGCNVPGIIYRNAIAGGFDTYDKPDDVEWNELKNAWIDEIAKRRQQKE